MKVSDTNHEGDCFILCLEMYHDESGPVRRQIGAQAFGRKSTMWGCSGYSGGVPSSSIDCCVTSPPYWGQREYSNGGIGLEATPEAYINRLCAVISEIRRVLTPAGSFRLNIGDAYRDKSLVGLPWRAAIKLMDEQEWILRNDVIRHKVKGAPDNSKDKLRHVYEDIFHFVLRKDYYYDVDAIRAKPRSARVRNGAVVSATGVSGVRYKRQIELAAALTDSEKKPRYHRWVRFCRMWRPGKYQTFA